jgi:holo-[acyl-carrier protein] synthase
MIIGIGTDMTDCRRLEKVIDRHGERFLNKIFTQQEQAFCENRKINRIHAYGKTFAAKEAVLKAIGNTTAIKWHDIEVIRLSNGKPSLNISGTALKNLQKLIPDGLQLKYDISLSDESPYAVAFVVISAT